MGRKDHSLKKDSEHNWLALNHDSYLKPFLFILFQHDTLITLDFYSSAHSVNSKMP